MRKYTVKFTVEVEAEDKFEAEAKAVELLRASPEVAEVFDSESH